MGGVEGWLVRYDFWDSMEFPFGVHHEREGTIDSSLYKKVDVVSVLNVEGDFRDNSPSPAAC